MTIVELLVLYFQSRLGRWCPSTFNGHRRSLARFVNFLAAAGVTRAGAISSQSVQGYRLHLDSLGLSAASIFGYFASVRTWLRWAFVEGHILFDPGREFSNSAPTAHNRFIPTQHQVKVLLRTPSPRTHRGRRVRTAFEVLYGTGLRRQEFLNLNLQDLQQDPPGLWVRRGKGGEDRLQPLGDSLLGVITGYLDQTRPRFSPHLGENALFLGRSGDRWGSQAFSKTFENYAERAGLPFLSPHGLRHAFASHLLENGAKLYEVQLLLGHSDIRTTERYTQIMPLELQKIYRRFHPRARRKALGK